MRSKYLAKMLKDKLPGDVTDLVLNNIETATFHEICHWMYGGQLKILAQNVCAIWNAAKKLQIDELVENCLRYLNTVGSHPSPKYGTISTDLAACTEDPQSNAVPKKKRVSLEKLKKKKPCSAVSPPESDEWLTVSEEEIIGAPDPQICNEKVEIPQKTVFRPPEPPLYSYKIERTYHVEPRMLLVRTSEEPKLAFLVARKHAEFLGRELETSEGNTVTVRHTSNRILSKVLQWSLDGLDPLAESNIRAILQLTNQLRLHELVSKSVEFWRNCVRRSDDALKARARCNWPLLSPYPFLVDLVTAKFPCRNAGISDLEGNGDHENILLKALMGIEPKSVYNLVIPRHVRDETETKKANRSVIPNSIKIHGLRKTLALLKMRRTKIEAPRVPQMEATKEVPKIVVPSPKINKTSNPLYSKNVVKNAFRE